MTAWIMYVSLYLSDVLLLLLAQRQLDEDLLQLLVAVVDDELLEAVVLRETEKRLFQPFRVAANCQLICRLFSRLID